MWGSSSCATTWPVARGRVSRCPRRSRSCCGSARSWRAPAWVPTWRRTPNPFPPGRGRSGCQRCRTGARPRSRAEASLVLIDTRTSHDLYVGGRCAISWRIEVGLGAADGAVDGSGVATAKSELRCDEPTAQVQADAARALRHRGDRGRRAALPRGRDRADAGRRPGADRLREDDPHAAFRAACARGRDRDASTSRSPTVTGATYGAIGTVTVSSVPAS